MAAVVGVFPDDIADWERTQAKTFLKWMNMYLAKRGMSIANFGEDLKNGEALINLIEVISNEPLGRYKKGAKSKIQQIENLQLPINYVNDFIRSVKLGVTYSAENIYDEDFKRIMGMIFVLIHKFEINDSGLDGKDGLLLWCKKHTEGYKDVAVENFSNSWKDGLAFAALIHNFRPDLVDFDSLSKVNPMENLTKAFDAAETLGIPRLLDPEDIAESVKPDDKAVMTQLAHYWKILSKLAKASVGKERVAAVLGRFKMNRQMQDDYTKRAQALNEWIKERKAAMESAAFGDTVADVQAAMTAQNKYYDEEKPEKMKEKLAVNALLRSLQAKQRIEKAPVFTPSEELDPATTDGLWTELDKAEVTFDDAAQKALAAARARELEIARLQGRMKKLEEWIAEKKSGFDSASLGDNRFETEGLIRAHDAVMQEFGAWRKRAEDINNNAPNYKEVGDAASELKSSLEGLEKQAEQRKADLEKQLAEHLEFEKKQSEVAAQVQSLLAVLDDIAEQLEQPVKVYSSHDVNYVQEHITKADEALTANQAAIDSLMEAAAAVADKPNPYCTFTPEQVKERFDALKVLRDQKKEELGSEEAGLHKLDGLKKEFAAGAEDLEKFINESMAVLDGNVLEATEDVAKMEEHLSDLRETRAKVEAEAESKLATIKEVKARMVEAGETVGEQNEFTTLTLPALVTRVEAISAEFGDKEAIVQSRIVAQKGMELSPEQLEEMKNNFKFFDKQDRGKLNLDEFRQCQESLGQELPDEQLKTVFEGIDKDKDGFISFDEFVEYMASVMRVTDSYGDILHALQEISGDFISADKLSGILSADIAEYVLEVAPKGENGDVDVKALLDMVFDAEQRA